MHDSPCPYRILGPHTPARLRLSNEERTIVAEIGKTAGAEGSCESRPSGKTRLVSQLVAQKFDGSKRRSYPGRPRIDAEVESLIVQMAREDSGWGYDRIAGALANLGYAVSDQTIGNVLRRQGIASAPKRSQTTAWKEFIAAHMAVLAGMDFFTAEVLTWRGLATYYVLNAGNV